MPNFSNMSDTDLSNWVNNFIEVAGADPEKYGVTAAQITHISAKANDFKQSMVLRQTAEDALKSAVLAQRASRESVEPELSYLNITIKANPAVSDADKQSIGIEPNKPPTYTPPIRPEDLVANGFEDNRNVLKWKRAGNKQNTQFIIECKKGDSAEFIYLDTTAETTYQHLGVTPGERCVYRVKAKRAGGESTYSNEALVY